MIKEIKMNETFAEELYNLYQKAYLVEATYLGTKDFPPLRETKKDILCSKDTFLVYIHDGKITAVISYVGTKSLFIHHMAVLPDFFHKRMASKLLEEIKSEAVYEIKVCTGARNAPARALYEKQDFKLQEIKCVSGNIELAVYLWQKVT